MRNDNRKKKHLYVIDGPDHEIPVFMLLITIKTSGLGYRVRLSILFVRSDVISKPSLVVQSYFFI